MFLYLHLYIYNFIKKRKRVILILSLSKARAVADTQGLWGGGGEPSRLWERWRPAVWGRMFRVGISADLSGVGSLGGGGWPTGLWRTSMRLPWVCVIPGSNRAFGERLGLQLPPGPPRNPRARRRWRQGRYRATRWLPPHPTIVVAVAMTCSCFSWALHLCLLNVGRGRHGERTAFQDSQLGRDGEAGVGPLLGGYPRPWTPAPVSLTLTSTFLLLSHGTLRPAGGGSALIATDGGVVACPGCPPACTCATLASLRTAHCCRSPGAQLLGCFPEELCAACTWLPPAFSPASRGPSGTPSRHGG